MVSQEPPVLFDSSKHVCFVRKTQYCEQKKKRSCFDHDQDDQVKTATIFFPSLLSIFRIKGICFKGWPGEVETISFLNNR